MKFLYACKEVKSAMLKVSNYVWMLCNLYRILSEDYSMYNCSQGFGGELRKNWFFRIQGQSFLRMDNVGFPCTFTEIGTCTEYIAMLHQYKLNWEPTFGCER